jgi:two-component system cell cycle sensor histidine kinase/response regulator CckA
VSDARAVADALAASQARVRELEAKLAEACRQQALFEGVVSRLPVIVFQLDADGRFLASMGAGLVRLGLSDGQVVGMDALELFPEAATELRDALAGASRVFETSGTSAAGPWWFLTFCAFDAVSGSGLVAFSIDVTESRLADQRHATMETQLRQVQKLESLGLLAGGVAHDFNNLLTGILGNASLALSRMLAGSPGQRELGQIEKASRRAAELCQQLLAYSGKGRFVVQPVDLSALVRETTRLLEVSIAKHITMTYACRAGLPAVEGDVTQLRQVIMNVVINAAEAVGEATGTVSLVTGTIDCDAAYLAETYLNQHLRPGRYVFLEVSDTGCGMDAETQAQMFDPFFTTKVTGRGLGMAAVLGIVRGHGGAIKIYSEPGRGTTAKVLLPVSDKAVPASQARGEQVDAPRYSGVALVIDDEPLVRTLAGEVLSDIGFDVIQACDGEEGIEVFKAHADKVCLVLLDLTMPKKSGDEVLRELRRLRPDVRVVLSSGYNEQDTTARFAGKGLAGFLQKPYSAAGLERAVREAYLRHADKT